MKRLFDNQRLSAACGRGSNSNRVISLLLSFALLISMMPQMLLFTVRSEEREEQGSDTNTTASDFGQYVGYTATFADYYEDFVLAADASKVTDYQENTWTGSVQYSLIDFIGDDSELSDEEYYALVDEFYAMKMIVTDYFVSEEDHGALWFKVEAAEGVTLPQTLQDNPWIFAYYSGMEGDEENTALYLTKTEAGDDLGEPALSDPETGVAIYGEVPDGAALNVQIPEINGETIPGLYDIKIIVDGEEWQPIDEGKTVTVSIPVEGVEEGVADVTHYIDYADDINGDETFIPVADFSDDELSLLSEAVDAYEAAYGIRDHVAVEEYTDVSFSGGAVTIETDSFSIFTADGADVGQLSVFLNIGGLLDGETLDDKVSKNGFVAKHNVAESTDGVYDNGFYYIDMSTEAVNEDTMRITLAWDDVATGRWFGSGLVGFWYTFSMAEDAQISVTYIPISGQGSSYDLELTASSTGELKDGDGRNKPMVYADLTVTRNDGDRYIVVATAAGETVRAEFLVANPKIEFTAQFLDPNGFIATGEDLPEDIGYYFDPEDAGEETATFPEFPTKDGYAFTGWMLREPAGDWPSDGTLYQPGDPLSGHVGNVTFVAQAVEAPYGYEIIFKTIAENPAAENMPVSPGIVWSTEPTYTFNWSDLSTPTREGYELVGWILDPGGLQDVSNRAVTLTGTAGEVTTVTIYPTWKGKNDAMYTVNHWFAKDPNKAKAELKFTEEDFERRQTVQRYGEIGTVAHVQGFVVPGYYMEVPEVTITADGKAVVNVYYYFEVYDAVWNWYDDTLGNQTTTVSYNYGATITPIEITRAGYTLVGWDGYTEGMTMPLENVTFTATWRANDDVAYTVEHWYVKDESANKDDSQLDKNSDFEKLHTVVGYGSTGDKTTAQAIPKTGFVTPTDAEIEQLMQTIAGDGSTVVRIYYYRDSFYVTWYWYHDTEGEQSPRVSYKYGATIVKADAPIRSAYTFAYWDGYTDGMTMPANDVTFTAIWKAKVFALYYITVEGEYFAPQEGDYNTPVTVTGDVPTRTGYTFAGWNTKDDGSGTSYKAGDTITLDGDKILYAQWTINQYTVTWVDGFGNKLKSEALDYNSDLVYPADPTWTGYTFLGWNINISKVPAEDVTITAQWEIVKYEVKFTPIIDVTNGDALVTLVVGHNGTVTLPTPVPADSGFTFNYWLIGDTKYNAGQSVTVTEDMEFVADWTPRPCVVTYVIEGVSGGVTVPVLEPHGDAYGTPDFELRDIPTVTGHDFVSIVAVGQTTGTEYQITDHCITLPAEDVTIVITYQLKTFEITWIIDGVETVVPYQYGGTIARPADPEKTGYTFAGWGGTVPGIMPARDLTFIAQWTPISYRVSFNANGGTGTMGSMDFVYDVSRNLTANGFTRDGYTFAGWKDENGNTYSDGQSVSNLTAVNGATVTLTAQWTPISYRVSFNANGGTGTMGSMDFVYDVSRNLTANGFTRDGYTFAGWKDENGNTYSDGQSVSNLTTVNGDTVTLYAQWEPAITSLTITVSGGAGSVFLFEISGDGLNNGLMVAIPGGTSATIDGLKVGAVYTITELTNWSWEYADVAAKQITLAASANVVTFSVTKTESGWLDGEGSASFSPNS